MFLLAILYLALGTMPQQLVVVPTDPLMTLEECTEVAETLAVKSVIKDPELAPYKFYLCVKESI